MGYSPQGRRESDTTDGLTPPPLTPQAPWWFISKESACQWGRRRSDPWIGKISWRRNWQPAPIFLPGKISWTEEAGGYSS